MSGWINLIGLALNFAGTLILFRYGYPQPSLEPVKGMGWGVDDEAVEAKRQHLRRSKIALVLIVVGFIFQFYSEMTKL